MPRGTETVTVVRKPKATKLGPVDSTPPVEFDLEGCQVLPGQTFEQGRGWVTVDGWDVWVLEQPEQEPVSTDHVVVRGETFAIEGRPARFDKRGQFRALQIKARRVA